MRVLLIQHVTWLNDAYPLGLGYVAAVLQKAGHEVMFIDLALVEGETTAHAVEEARRLRAQAVGLTSMTPTYGEALDLIRAFRKALPGVTVIMGGHHPSIFPEKVLREGGADVVVISEGELTAPPLFECLEKGGDLSLIPGIAFLDKGGRYVETSPASYIQELDDVPFPHWDVLNPAGYRGRLRGRPIANIFTSRGCPFKCTFCDRGPSAGKRYRKRSPENILAEIRLLRQRYGIRAFAFWDDIFTLDMKHTRELCRRIAAEEPGVIWKCQTRADRVNLDLLRAMKRAGCVSVSFGVESGNEEILKKMKKGITKDQNRRAFRDCRKARLPSIAYFIIGTPWETPRTIRETIAFAIELKALTSYFFIATPYPRTELEDEFRKVGWNLPGSYDDYRLYTWNMKNSEGLNEFADPRRKHFAAVCGQASREVNRARLLDVRDYPRLIRSLLTMYTFSECVVKAYKMLGNLPVKGGESTSSRQF